MELRDEIALAHGHAAIGPDSLPSFWYRDGLSDRVAFAVQWRLARPRTTP